MMKILTLLFVFTFIATGAMAATTTVGGQLKFMHKYDTNADQDKDTKGAGTAITQNQGKQSEFRNYAKFWINSQINDKLYGKIALSTISGTREHEKWGTELPGVGATGFNMYEGYFNYMPIEGLNVRVGRQAWKFGKGLLISDKDSDSLSYAQNGMMLSYEMPELFKASLLYSLLDTDESDGDYLEEKPIKADKFYALWLHTGLVPFLQDINLVYATKYQSDDNDTTPTPPTSKDNVDDTLTTMGVDLMGNAMLGPVKLIYGVDYYMNGGKDKTGATEVKYKGSYMSGGLTAIMPELYGLNFGATYISISGDDTADGDDKSYHRVHNGATLITDAAEMWAGYGSGLLTSGNGTAPGVNIMRFRLGAMPMKDFKALVEYSMYSANKKAALTAAASIADPKAALVNKTLLKLDYTGIENLSLMLAIGMEKYNKDNFPAATGNLPGKDGHYETKFAATYMF